MEHDDLDRRGTQTLLASWEAYARGAVDAAVHRRPHVAAAVFASGPERGVYNNAVLTPRLGAEARAAAVETMEAFYEAAGVGHFAAWVQEDDAAMRRELERRGYVLDTSTLAMGIVLDDVADARPPDGVDLGPASWEEYLACEDLPSTFLQAADHAALHVLAARAGGEILATGLAFDHGGDCGIYNVGTRPEARRRGLATAVTAAQLRAARERGCRTASLQSTQLGEGVYRAVGFRPLHRILEYTPAT